MMGSTARVAKLDEVTFERDALKQQVSALREQIDALHELWTECRERAARAEGELTALKTTVEMLHSMEDRFKLKTERDALSNKVALLEVELRAQWTRASEVRLYSPERTQS